MKIKEDDSDIILSVAHLKKDFPLKGGFFSRQQGILHAVDDVSFNLGRNRGLGLVGESGSGKTTLGKCLLRLIEPTSGEVRINGLDMGMLSRKDLVAVRTKMQMIYQNPYAALNPRMTIEKIVSEGLDIQNQLPRSERKDRVAGLLERVGLSPESMLRYPHEFSGGQRQRVGIARALALQPDLIVADEPVSALDVSIQAQVINLMMDLKAEYGLTYIIISHDLAVVQHMCDTIAVMYLGKIVEMAGVDQLYESPRHPYTRLLLSSVPLPDPDRGRRPAPIQGEIPSPANPPDGCYYHPRCSEATDRCRHSEPLFQSQGGGHWVACHPANKL